MSVKIQISNDLIIQDIIAKKNNLEKEIDCFSLNEKPFQKGVIEIRNLVNIYFENSSGDWLFVTQTDDRTRSFAITKENTIKAIQPKELEWWLTSEVAMVTLKYSIAAFKYVQGRAYRNRKILFSDKKYETREHEFLPKETNKTIKIDEGVNVIFSNNAEETRDYIRHIEAWGVRGHERHYKSGKVVFVKPYTKGKGKVKETTYEIT